MMRWIEFARQIRLGAVLALLLAVAADPAGAQSLFANRGLGLVVDPQDGRSAALGGVRLGLPDSGLSWSNPAAAAGLPAPGFLGSLQYDAFNADYTGGSSDGSTARFPLILASFPFGRWGVTVGYGGFVDQNWSIENPDTLRLERDTVPVLDRLQSEGGVARLRAGASYLIREGLSVGAALDVYTGAVLVSSGRIFPSETQPSCCRANWHYSGVGIALGARFAPSEALSLAVALQQGGTLKATGQEPETGDESYQLPLTLQAGASGRVAGNLLIAISGERTGWSVLDEALTNQGGARDAWSAHGGVEYDGLSIRDRTIPLRLGLRRTDLPFGWNLPQEPAQFATERAVTGGLGVVLANGATRTDLGLERGSRGGDGVGIEEGFWRVTLSVQVLGL